VRLRKFVVLVAVVAALAAGAFVILHRKEADVRRERRDARLLDFDERSVTAVVLTTAGAPWRFERREEGWRLSAPVEDAASDEAIADLMSAVERVAVTRILEDPEALSAYGLDPPVARVQFEGVGATLDIGDSVPTGGGLFARVEGRPGVLVLEATVVSDSTLGRLDPTQFRDPSFVGLTSTSIDAIAARSRAGEVRLEHGGDGWWIVAPRRLPASEDSVARLLQILDHVEIRAFDDHVDPMDPAFGLTPPAFEIEVSSGDTTRRLRLSAEFPEGLRFATRDDRACVMEIATPGLDDPAFSPATLVTRRLSSVNRYRIERFVYRNGDESLAAERSGETWSAEGGATLPSAEIYTFLAGLLETPVTGWRDSSGSPAGAVAEFRYRLDGGQEGSIEFLPGGLGRVSDVPGILFALGGSPPRVP